MADQAARKAAITENPDTSTLLIENSSPNSRLIN